MNSFTLTDEQVAQFKEWSAKFRPTGCSGGAFTFSFTPTSIGMIVKVSHVSGDSIDLSDYDNW